MYVCIYIAKSTFTPFKLLSALLPFFFFFLSSYEEDFVSFAKIYITEWNEEQMRYLGV